MAKQVEVFSYEVILRKKESGPDPKPVQVLGSNAKIESGNLLVFNGTRMVAVFVAGTWEKLTCQS